MKAGKYWIGDLCYLIPDEEWRTVVAFLGNGRTPREGEFTLQGHEGAIFSTYQGDGVYQDQFGNSYGVDSGTIGIFPADVFEGYFFEGGTVHEIPHDFTPRSFDGNMDFGGVQIKTKPAPLPEFSVEVSRKGETRIFPMEVVDECYCSKYTDYPGLRVGEAEPDLNDFAGDDFASESINYAYAEGQCNAGSVENERGKVVFSWRIVREDGEYPSFQEIESAIFAHYLIVKED